PGPRHPGPRRGDPADRRGLPADLRRGVPRAGRRPVPGPARPGPAAAPGRRGRAPLPARDARRAEAPTPGRVVAMNHEPRPATPDAIAERLERTRDRLIGAAAGDRGELATARAELDALGAAAGGLGPEPSEAIRRLALMVEVWEC